jgi:hypothetical protein
MTDDEIALPTKPSGEFVSYCDAYSDGAWRGFDADDMESYARAAVLLDRQQHALRWLAEADRALGLSYDDDAAAPSADLPPDIAAEITRRLPELFEGDVQPAPSAEPFSQKEIALMNEKWLHRKALGLAEPQPSAEPVQIDKPADIKTDAISYGEEVYRGADIENEQKERGVEPVVFGHYCRYKAGKHPDGWVCQPFYTESAEWLLAQCEAYQKRAHEAEREVVRLRAALEVKR